MGFILKILNMLADIKSSCDTVLIDQEKKVICNMEGFYIPGLRLAFMQRQGDLSPQFFEPWGEDDMQVRIGSSPYMYIAKRAPGFREDGSYINEITLD